MSIRTGKKRIRDRRIDWEFESRIRERASQGASPTQIKHDLEKEFPENGSRKIPDPRVIREIVKEHIAEDHSGQWHLGDAEDDAGAAAVLEAMAAVHKYRYDAVITRAEADWIARIAPHANGLEGHSWWILARQYLACEANERTTLPIDLLLAFKPWREKDPWRRTAYEETLERLGLKPLTYLWLVPDDTDE